MFSETRSCSARFSNRASAERAVEHLIQQTGVDPTDIDIRPEGADNSAGEIPSGGDVGPDMRDDPPLEGALIVTVSSEQPANVLNVMRNAGGVGL